MEIQEVIVHNPVKEFEALTRPKSFGFEEAPNPSIAENQFNKFMETLAEEGVKVYSLTKSIRTKPHLYKIRDSAFIYKREALISNFSESFRKGEEVLVKGALKSVGIKLKAQVFTPGTFEACNVIFLDKKRVLVGIGKRLNNSGLKKFLETFPQLEMIKVQSDARLIHHINVVDGTVVIDEQLCYTDVYQTLKEMEFDFLIVTSEEVKSGAVEFVQLGKNKVLNVVSTLNKRLKMRGYDVITLDMSELVKGNAGCASMLLPVDYKP